jgi:hypothetical protein
MAIVAANIKLILLDFTPNVTIVSSQSNPSDDGYHGEAATGRQSLYDVIAAMVVRLWF